MENKTTPKARSRNTTVAISPDVAEKLDRFCRANGMTKKDFVSESLTYFLKEGINPKVHESPQAEIKKITKRIDQFFAFFKKQEQEMIKPLMLEIVQNGNYQTQRFGKVLQHHKEITSKIDTVNSEVKTKSDTINMDAKFSSLETNITGSNKEFSNTLQTNIAANIATSNGQIIKALEAIGKHLDPKDKKGLLGTLTDIFK